MEPGLSEHKKQARAQHNALERRRRDNIKDMYGSLKDEIASFSSDRVLLSLPHSLTATTTPLILSGVPGTDTQGQSFSVASPVVSQKLIVPVISENHRPDQRQHERRDPPGGRTQAARGQERRAEGQADGEGQPTAAGPHRLLLRRPLFGHTLVNHDPPPHPAHTTIIIMEEQPTPAAVSSSNQSSALTVPISATPLLASVGHTSSIIRTVPRCYVIDCELSDGVGAVPLIPGDCQ